MHELKCIMESLGIINMQNGSFFCLIGIFAFYFTLIIKTTIIKIREYAERVITTKFLHLADLHIGKRVNEFSMIEDQRYILRKLLEIIEQEQVEGVWIAGDVYDKAVPSAEAVQVLDEFLTSLAKRNLPVVLISGNHDSPERLSFGSSMLSKQKVYMSPVYNGNIEPIVFTDEHGELYVYPLPFLKPAPVRQLFPDMEIESYQDAVAAAISKLNIDKSKRNVLLAHQFVTGAQTSESEELSVGGLDNVDVTIFDDFDYVALGHIHRPQTMGRDTVCYAGTPLKYSFSAANHQKAAVIVDVKEKRNIEIKKNPLIPKRHLREIRGTYMEVTAKNFYKDSNQEDYMHITLTDEEDIPEVIGKLRVIYPNLMKVDYDNTRTRQKQEVLGVAKIEEKSPLELFEEFYQLQNNQEMSEDQVEFAKTLMEQIW